MSTPRKRAAILGTGACVPDKVLTNAALEKLIDTSDEWIYTRTGIRERRIVENGVVTSDLAAEAARRALADAHLSPDDVSLIICSTITPDYAFPSTACMIQQKIGAHHTGGFDLSAACAGFIYGVTIADQFIRNGTARCILVIGVELLSRILNWKDRTTCVLFGDGAGAVVLGPSRNGAGILATQLFTDGSLAHALHIPAGGSAEPYTPEGIESLHHKVHMSGSEVFKTAVKNLTSASSAAVKASGLKSTDIDWVVAHQANMRILDQVATRLGFPLSKFVLNIENYGNTSSASIPIALDEAVRDGRIKAGQHVLMCALGAGISWGSAVVRM